MTTGNNIPVDIEGFKAWWMTWASQIGVIMCYFLTIYTLGCREPAWNLGDQLFWNLTVNFHFLSENHKMIKRANSWIFTNSPNMIRNFLTGIVIIGRAKSRKSYIEWILENLRIHPSYDCCVFPLKWRF